MSLLFKISESRFLRLHAISILRYYWLAAKAKYNRVMKIGDILQSRFSGHIV